MYHQIYIHVSSDDSRAIFPQNTCNRFYVQLPKSLHFTGVWEVGLCELQYHQTFSEVPVNIDICTPLCEDTVVDGKCQDILRRVNVTGEVNQVITKTFDRVQYFKVTRPTVDHILMYIREDGKDKATLMSGTFRCTLHFRRYVSLLSTL